MEEFGKYRLVAELGRGGMAEVLLALEQGPVGFNKLVVIKRIRDHLAEDTDFISMLIDEARLAAKLNHPNIVNTTEVGEVDSVFYMAMEYLQGQPFSRVIRRGQNQERPIPVELQARIIADMLSGLKYAHELTDFDGSPLGVVHRDISPSNLFVTYDGVVKVVDFGIAKASGRVTETKTGVVKGKMTYIAPEQALGDLVDHRADLFSVGVMLWEAAVGERMWGDKDEIVILGKLISEEWPRSPKERNPDVPDALDAIVQKALAPDPSDRFADAEKFREAIEEWLDTLPKAPTQRSVATLMTDLFRKEREEIQDLINDQLSRLEQGATSLRTVDLAGAMSMNPESQSSTAVSPGVEPSEPPISAHTRDLERARRRSLIGLWTGLLSVVFLGIVILLRSEESDDDAPEPPPPPVAEAAPAPPPATAPPSTTAKAVAPANVTVAIDAEPRNARFYINDGAPLDNPYRGEHERDGDVHVVRIEAPGHRSKEVTVRFDGPVELNVKLEPVERGVGLPPPPPPAAKPPPPEPPPPPPLVPPSPKPDIDIDRGDPWSG